MSAAHYSPFWHLFVFSEYGKRIDAIGKKIVDTVFFFIVGGLAIVFLGIVLVITSTKQDIQNLGIKTNPLLRFHPAPYPFLADVQTPGLPTGKSFSSNFTAESAIILDKDSDVVVYEKNSNFRFSPASTTKIMTAYTALQYFHLTDVLTVKKVIDTQGSGLNLTLGEDMTFENLLKAALIYSANDAAVTIAQNYPGGEDAFITAMNNNAKKLHLIDTHYGDPAGLNDDSDYTTAQDLVRLAAIAMQNPIFAHIVNMRTATVTNVDNKNTYVFDNRNILLGVDGINGIKTGYTDEAGEVLATSLMKNGHTFYLVVMKSQDRFADTRKLLPMLDQVTYISF